MYSIATGAWKGIKHALIFIISLAVVIIGAKYVGLLDTPITDLVTKYIFPLIGTATLGGVITFVLNWLKQTAK